MGAEVRRVRTPSSAASCGRPGGRPEGLGPARVMAVAVAGVPLGAALMAVPGPGLLAIIGMMTLGLAAAPIFPLLTLTTAQRIGAAPLAIQRIGAAPWPCGW